MDRATLLILVVVATTVSAATGSCPPGQHVLEDRCRDCDSGTFSSDGQCERCAPGFYQPKTGQLACFPCQAGHFANSPGATSCKPCDAGHFAPRQGAAVCSECPQGHQQPQAGQSACIPDYIVAMQRNIDDVILLLLEKNKYQQQTIDRHQDQIKVLQEKIYDQEQQQQKINDSMNLEIQQLNQETSSLKADHDLAIHEIQQLRLTVDQNSAIVTTRVAFSAVRKTSSQYETVSGDHNSFQTVMFNKVLTNIGGGFDTRTATFVCPVAGPYYITHDMTVVGGHYGITMLSVNGVAITGSLTQDNDYVGMEGFGVVVELSKGDKVKVVADGGSTFNWWDSIGNKHLYSSVFSGFLLK